jgi:ABC-type uncharacterized transport system YnjBCD substrate-binding protein
MWGYQVEIDDMRASGNTAGEAAEQAAREAPGDTISEIRAAMPGSSSMEAAGLLAAQWNEELPAWVDGMRSYAESLGRSAKVYESNDSAAERAFGGAPGGRRPI